MSRFYLERSLALAGSVIAVAGCVNVGWVTIDGASATDPSATTLHVAFDFCATTPPQVTETTTEVRLLINLKVDKSGAQKRASVVQSYSLRNRSEPAQ